MPIEDEPFEPLHKKPQSCANLRHANLDDWNFDNLISMKDILPSHPILRLSHTQKQKLLNNGWDISDGGRDDS